MSIHIQIFKNIWKEIKVYKFPLKYSRSIQMINKIHEKAYKYMKKYLNFHKNTQETYKYLTKNHEKACKKLKYFITWHIKPKIQSKNIYEFNKNHIHLYEKMDNSYKTSVKITIIQQKCIISHAKLHENYQKFNKIYIITCKTWIFH